MSTFQPIPDCLDLVDPFDLRILQKIYRRPQMVSHKTIVSVFLFSLLILHFHEYFGDELNKMRTGGSLFSEQVRVSTIPFRNGLSYLFQYH